MVYPTLEEVELADRIQLCRWNRFLPSPTSKQLVVLNRILSRVRDIGGMTPEISKLIGWDKGVKLFQ